MKRAKKKTKKKLPPIRWPRTIKVGCTEFQIDKYIFQIVIQSCGIYIASLYPDNSRDIKYAERVSKWLADWARCSREVIKRKKIKNE